MSSTNSVARITSLSEHYYDIQKLLVDSPHLTHVATLDSNYKKNLLLACASYHEYFITSMINEFLDSFGNVKIESLGRMLSKRRYHQFFEWRSSNINSFLKLFGDKFQADVNATINAEPILQDSIKDFLSIGNQRNDLVHNNFIDHMIDDTFNDINKKFTSSLKIIEFINTKLNQEK